MQPLCTGRLEVNPLSHHYPSKLLSDSSVPNTDTNLTAFILVCNPHTDLFSHAPVLNAILHRISLNVLTVIPVERLLTSFLTTALAHFPFTEEKIKHTWLPSILNVAHSIRLESNNFLSVHLTDNYNAHYICHVISYPLSLLGR